MKSTRTEGPTVGSESGHPNENGMVRRCKHERETCKVLTAETHYVDVFCTACQSGWRGRPYAYEARRHLFTFKPPRMVSPPKWVLRALRGEYIPVLNESAQPSAGREPSNRVAGLKE